MSSALEPVLALGGPAFDYHLKRWFSIVRQMICNERAFTADSFCLFHTWSTAYVDYISSLCCQPCLLPNVSLMNGGKIMNQDIFTVSLHLWLSHLWSSKYDYATT